MVLTTMHIKNRRGCGGSNELTVIVLVRFLVCSFILQEVIAYFWVTAECPRNLTLIISSKTVTVKRWCSALQKNFNFVIFWLGRCKFSSMLWQVESAWPVIIWHSWLLQSLRCVWPVISYWQTSYYTIQGMEV